MQFDPQSAKDLYAQKEIDELVGIAFLEDTYLPEAKKLALAELARRGFRTVSPEMIERVRVLRREELEDRMRSLESEVEIPPWRQSARRALLPYRPMIQVTLIAVAILMLLDGLFEVGIFGPNWRIFLGVGALIGVLASQFIAPTREEFLRKHGWEDEERK